VTRPVKKKRELNASEEKKKTFERERLIESHGFPGSGEGDPDRGTGVGAKFAPSQKGRNKVGKGLKGGGTRIAPKTVRRERQRKEGGPQHEDPKK